MKFTTLKKMNRQVSQMGIGTNKVGGHNYFSDLNETEGKNFVKEAVQLGVNFIDTADVYGLGRSEELVGETLQEIDTKREDLILATKGGVEWDQEGNKSKNNHPDYLRTALENSLKRLQTDYVDIYYLHFPDNETPIAEAVGELSRLKEEGKIKAIGVSNLNLEQLKEADQATEITALQSAYNMFERSVEKDVLPYCAENGISFIPYFPLAAGLLSGKYTAQNPGHDRFRDQSSQEKLAKVKKLQEVAEAKNTTMPNLALAWLLAQKGVDAIIPGGRRPDQIQGVMGALQLTLTNADLDKIDTILQ